MPSPFDLGFERGSAWARRNEGLEKPHPDSWAGALIRELGEEAVAGLFGTQAGGLSWSECCREYNAGCDAGVCVCRRETGPEKLGRECAKEAVEIVTADPAARGPLPADPEADDYKYLGQRIGHAPTENEVRAFITGYRSYLQGLIVICREEDGITTWVNSGSLNRHGSMEALTVNLGEDVYTVIEGQLAQGLTEGKVVGKRGVYTWSLQLPGP